jgi:hypothetical protein
VREIEEGPLHVHSQNIWYVVKNQLVYAYACASTHLPTCAMVVISHLSRVAVPYLSQHAHTTLVLLLSFVAPAPFLLLHPYTARSMHLCTSTMGQNCDVGLFFVDFACVFVDFEL